MSNGSVRTIGATSASMDEEDSKLPRRPLERICDASRGIYQQARRRASEQVNARFIFLGCKIEGIGNKIPISYSNGIERKKSVLFLVCRVERSSDQIIKPVNLEALTKWVGHIPDDVVREMPDIAPMLSVLGYDPYANPPVYGAPDRLVSENTRRYVIFISSVEINFHIHQNISENGVSIISNQLNPLSECWPMVKYGQPGRVNSLWRSWLS